MGESERGFPLSWWDRLPPAPPLAKEFHFLALGLLFVFFFPQPEDIWRKETYAGVVFASLFLGAMLGRLYGLITGATFFVFSALSATVWASHVRHAPWQDSLSAQSMAFLWAAVLPIAFMRRESQARGLNTLILVAITTSTILLTRAATGDLVYSFMNNSAADAAIIAALFPLLAFREWPWLEKITNQWTKTFLVCLPVVAIAVAGGSTGVASLGVAGLAWYFATAYRHPHKRKKALGVLLGLAIAAGCAIPVMKEGFFNDNGRFRVWGITMRFFYDPVTPCVANAKTNDERDTCMKSYINPITGAGAGSFLLLGPQSQGYAGSDGRVLFIFAHNEPIQIFFEQGKLGLFFFTLFALFLGWKSFDRPWLFSALCTYGFTTLTQFPFRFFGSALIGAILAREALEKKE